MKKETPFAVWLTRNTLQLLGMIAPGIAANWIYKIWFSTPRYPVSKRETRWREQAQLDYMEINGDRIAVYRWGKAGQPCVYLVHGWSGHGAQLGAFVKPLNELGYTVIAFDAVGHGQSSGKSANIFRITDELKTIIEHHGKPAHFIAHSFGCMVVALLIKKYHIIPFSLVSISSPTRFEYLLELFTQALSISDSVMTKFIGRLKKDFGDDFYHVIAADENLKGSSIPALIVHDKNDRDVGREYSQRLLDVMPQARALFTEGLGHRLVLRNKQIIREIITFITETKDAG